MSRRRVSVKDLGAVDCQGWLHRRKEGRSFLGSKWKKYWFVLKKSSLYWYTDKMADKAEGFISLSGFTIEQAKQCKKKHAITATHPLVVTIFIAAESFTEMNKWISKLSEAAEPCDVINTSECYSEGSDQDGDECVSTSQDSEQETADFENGDSPQPPPCASTPPSVTTTDTSRGTSEGGALQRIRRRAATENRERLSRPDRASRAMSLPPNNDGEEQAVHSKHLEPQLEPNLVTKTTAAVTDCHLLVPEKPPDEMESLYKDLQAASLSPMGRCSRRDFRASFIKRSKNDKVNEKLHRLRILNSTLKAKELELLAVEQILTDPPAAAAAYREWSLSNQVLLQQVRQRYQAAGGAAELKA